MLDKLKTNLTPNIVLALMLCIIFGGFFFLNTSIHRNILYVTLCLGLLTIHKEQAWGLFKNKDLLWRLTLLFLGISLISVAWSQNEDAERIWQKIKPALFIIMTMICIILTLKKYPKSWQTALEIFVFCAVLSALSLSLFRMNDIVSFYFLGTSEKTWRLEGFGRTENSNLAGILYGIAALFSLFLKGQTLRVFSKPLVRRLCFIFLFIILFITLSRGAIFAFAGTLGILFIVFLTTPELIKKHAKIICIGFSILAILTIIILISVPDIGLYMIERGTTGRFQIWQIAWAHIMEKPLLGHGVGTKFRYIVFDKMPIDTGHAHNLYFSILLQIGFIGFSSFLALGLLSMRQALKCAYKDKEYAPLIMLSTGFLFGLVDIGGYYTNLGVAWVIFWIPLSYLIYARLIANK